MNRFIVSEGQNKNQAVFLGKVLILLLWLGLGRLL